MLLDNMTHPLTRKRASMRKTASTRIATEARISSKPSFVMSSPKGSKNTTDIAKAEEDVHDLISTKFKPKTGDLKPL